MKKEFITVPEGTSIPEIIKSLGERTKNCWIYIDENLINKELLVERKPEGVYHICEDGCNMELDSQCDKKEGEGYWLLWYINKPGKKEPNYYITFFEEEIHFYIKKQ